MQEILVDAAVVGLFVFLFAATSSRRGDVRLRLWTAGWLSILAHFLAELWQPAGHSWHVVQASISMDALAVAGTCFVFSATIHQSEGWLIKHMGMALAVLTLITLGLAVDGTKPAWILAGLVAAR